VAAKVRYPAKCGPIPALVLGFGAARVGRSPFRGGSFGPALPFTSTADIGSNLWMVENTLCCLAFLGFMFTFTATSSRSSSGHTPPGRDSLPEGSSSPLITNHHPPTDLQRFDKKKAAIMTTPVDLPPCPSVSVKTMHMAGLLVDVHGLDELAQSATRITCLWLHHQRQRSKERMADIAARSVAAWNETVRSGSRSKPTADRGLIALAFDQRNHGSRLVQELSNESWNKGNETHAQDMFGVVAGAVTDQEILL
jgi:hypothetical protein